MCKAMIRLHGSLKYSSSKLLMYWILIRCKWSGIIHYLINRKAIVCFPLFARFVYSLAGIYREKKCWFCHYTHDLTCMKSDQQIFKLNSGL